MTYPELLSFIGLLITIIGLVSVVYWRNGLTRNRIYKKMDARFAEAKAELKEDYVRKDVFGIVMDRNNAEMKELKKEIDQIKSDTKLIPSILHDVEVLLRRSGVHNQGE